MISSDIMFYPSNSPKTNDSKAENCMVPAHGIYSVYVTTMVGFWL